MEHLTKQQIVLLTLFTSFVTSIATGIVTVALVDQAPAGVTSTINHVIEHTVEEVDPSQTQQAVNSSASDQSAAVGNAVTGIFSDPANEIENATAIGQQSLMRILLDNNVVGLGVVVASSGVIVSDKSVVVPGYGTYTALTSTGIQYPLQILQSQNNGNIVFLLAGDGSTLVAAHASTTGPVPLSGTSTKMIAKFIPVQFAPLSGAGEPQLGETVIAFSGGETAADQLSITEGVIEKINLVSSSTISSVETNINSADVSVGTPLFDTKGRVVGIRTLSNVGGNFYPIGYLQSIIPAL